MKRNYLAASILTITLIAASPLWAADQPPTTTTEDYTIGPGDVLSISVWDNTALPMAVTVLPDG